MKHKKTTLAYKRKRQGKTNYKKRLRLLISSNHRLVVRIFLKNISAQIIEHLPEGDKVIVSATAKELEKKGWKYHKGNVPSAYLTGLLIGKKAIEKGIKEAILDAGLKNPTKGSRIYACLKGAIDAGLDIAHSKEIFPDDSRIKGEHIAKYKESLSDISKTFEEIKNKIKVKA